MFNSDIPVEEYFQYHPVMTEKRRKAHDNINLAAMEFAMILRENIEDKETLKIACMAIQFARMMANQGAVVDELLSKETN